MAQTNFDELALKRALKEALAETLREERELLLEVFAEVLEDYALGEAIREGRMSKPAKRSEVFESLKDKS